MTNGTIFERVWDNPEEHLFLSETHEIMAAVDTFPKLPFQCVVAPRFGTPGEPAYFNKQPRTTKRLLFEVADAIGEKILANCTDTQRVVTHIEGYGVSDHPHIVLFAAERRQGADLYTGSNLGLTAVQRTLELIKFQLEEAEQLEYRLDQII